MRVRNCTGADAIDCGRDAMHSEDASSYLLRGSQLGSVIAVIVPVYQQAQFMREAIRSVERQSIVADVRLVIVNDGCPDPRTKEYGEVAAAGAVTAAYIEQPNRGLGAARNAGIREAFARWPEVRYVFPLDADNMLSSWSLGRLRAVMDTQPPETGWAYCDIQQFGDVNLTHIMQPRFNRWRLLRENFADAG